MSNKKDSLIGDTDRIESLLVRILLQLMKEKNQREHILELNRAGLSNMEVANHLETTTGVVGTTIYAHRKKTRRKC